MTHRVQLQPAWQRALFFMALALLLTACATPRHPATGNGEAWTGRLALRVDSEPVQSVSAGFILQGSAEKGSLLLTTPLGTSFASVNWNGAWAEWRQGDRVIQKQTLEELISEMGGSALPVAALFAWLKGQSVKTDGWQADLSRFADGRITARRLLPLPSAELRLIVQP